MPLRQKSYLAAAMIGVALSAAPAAYAQQTATTLEQAEMAGLSPQVRAEVETRMKQPGQTVSEVLTTILLNNIKLKHLGSRIVAMDFNRGVAAVRTARGGLRAVNFNPTTLEITS